MKTLKPIIQTEEPDKYGRTVKVGITDGTTASFFQVMSMGEARNLRDELTKFLNHSGAGTPVFDFKSFEGMRDRVKVGDTVRVRFEEFGMPDKHIPGRMVLPKKSLSCDKDRRKTRAAPVREGLGRGEGQKVSHRTNH